MAHLDQIASQQVDRIAEAIRDMTNQTSATTSSGVNNFKAKSRKESTEAGVQPQALTVNESLTIWKLKPGSFERLNRDDLQDDLSDWLEQTDMVYHQIQMSESPAGFARSTTGPNTKPISQLNLSPTSKRATVIHNALETIEQNKGDDPVIASDPVVRLLEIPPAHVVALWLYSEALRESRVMIISAAKRYVGLTENSLLNSYQFLEALKKQGGIPKVA